MVTNMKWNELIKVIVLTIASMLAVEAAVVVILTSSGLMSTQFGKANINDSGDGQTEQEV